MKMAHEIAETLQISKAHVKAAPMSKQAFGLSGHQEPQLPADAPNAESGLLKHFSFKRC